MQRKNYALERMLELGWLTHRQYGQALRSPTGLSDRLRSSAQTGPESFWEQYVINEFLEEQRDHDQEETHEAERQTHVYSACSQLRGG